MPHKKTRLMAGTGESFSGFSQRSVRLFSLPALHPQDPDANGQFGLPPACRQRRDDIIKERMNLIVRTVVQFFNDAEFFFIQIAEVRQADRTVDVYDR